MLAGTKERRRRELAGSGESSGPMASSSPSGRGSRLAAAAAGMASVSVGVTLLVGRRGYLILAPTTLIL